MRKWIGSILSHKKLLILLLFLLMIVCLHQGCSRYYSGDITLDPEVFNEENLEFIAQNWEHLVETGFMEIAVDTHIMRFGTEDYAITVSQTEAERYEGTVRCFLSFWEEGIPMDKKEHSFATYRRLGDSPYWWGWGKWGGGQPCLVEVRYCSEHACFQGWWMGADGTAGALNDLMGRVLHVLNEMEFSDIE